MTLMQTSGLACVNYAFPMLKGIMLVIIDWAFKRKYYIFQPNANI